MNQIYLEMIDEVYGGNNMGMALGGWEKEREEDEKYHKCKKNIKCNCEKCRKERYDESSFILRDDD